MKKSIILLSVAFFVFSNLTFAKGKTVLSVQVSKSFIVRTPDPDSICWKPETNHFSWQAGYIMFAMEKMWQTTGDSVYFNYIKRYVDQQVNNDGNIPDFKNNALDNFLPGYAILFMYEQTGLEKYKIAATHVRDGFNTYPRTNNGLFYHAAWTPGQAWVDGVFMGEIFLARYAKTIGDKKYAFAEVVKQMTLIAEKCQKPNGLFLHGWDENKKAKWADKTTGLAHEVWSEGLGWYAVLIADVFDYLPKTQPGREHLMAVLKKICAGLKNVQDPKTGMWCQVVDKPNEQGNWNETSGTGMYIYLIKKAMNKGYISKNVYQSVVEKAYQGIIKKTALNQKGFVDLLDCSSIGIKNTYAEYISSPKEVSPFSGFASFVIGTSSIEFK